MNNPEEKKEYLVQVTIIEARHITPKDESGMANPFVKMKVANLPIQTSEVQYQKLTPVWNQSFTFSNLLLSMNELQASELSFELWSKNNYMGNDLIGLYSIGLHTLYRNANHEFWNCWLTLNSPDSPTEAQGYLLVNCFIIGPGDKPPFHSINDNADQDQEEENEEINVDAMSYEELKAYQEKKEGIQILGKPSIARKSFQLSVYVFKAEHMVDFPSGVGYGKCSAFISARSVGLVNKTKYIKKNNGPVFNQKMLFPCYYPFLNDKILLRIWNYGNNRPDDFIANIPEFPAPNDFFNITKLISLGGRMPAKWINLYGIPPWERNTAFTSIKHPREGTAYLGRLLISFSLLANEKPTFTVMPCNPFYDPDSLPYVLYCDVYKLYFLKRYDVAVWCEVSIGQFKVRNRKMKVKSNDTVEWMKDEERNNIMLQGILEHFPKDSAQIPDIFINLYTGISDQTFPQRIGYIRLKVEEVMKWQPEPRWLHFKSLDMRDDSPGSVLVNLQFKLDSDMTRRIFKERSGMEKQYILYCHIVSGFELDPKNKDTEDSYDTKVVCELDGVENQTDDQNGRYPYFNKVLQIEKKLDMNLDFAPDVLIKVMRTKRKGLFGMSAADEELGRFSVPIRCCKEGYSLPHYFNLIRNNEKNGRLLANFYIEQVKGGIKKDLTPSFKNFKKVSNWLENKVNTNIEVAIIGLRDFDFTIHNQSANLEVSITGYKDKKKPKNDLSLIHHVDEKKESFLNILEIFKFENIEIFGTSDFMIFPVMTIRLTYKNFFFMEEERFLISSLKEFYSSQVQNIDNNNKIKMYRLIWEQNLDSKTIDQELIDINPDTSKKKKKIGNEDDEEEDEDEEEEEVILIKKEEEKKDKIDPSSKNVTDIMLLDKEKEKLKDTEVKKDEKQNVNLDKLLEHIRKYKNMAISNAYTLVCRKTDKESEKLAKKVLRKALKKERKELNKRDLADDEDVAKLLKLEKKIRDLSLPLMNEGIFYGFDDLSDDYDYGREVFKEDIYEFHSNMSFNYLRENLYYLPWVLSSEERAEDMGGYLKYGKKCGNILKYNVKISVLKNDEIGVVSTKQETDMANLNTEEKKEKKKIKSERTKKEKPDLNKIGQELKQELKTVDLFTAEYLPLLYNCYLNKNNRLGKDKTPIQFNNIKVRIYIYRCLNLAAADNCNDLVDYMAGYSAFCRANAFLELHLGDNFLSNETKQVKYINDVNNYQKDTLNPNFFKVYELEGDLPQDWKLAINVRSYAPGGVNHSLIGTTVIDLEDRYLCDHKNREMLKYKALEQKYNNLINTPNEDDEDDDQDLKEYYQSKLDKIDIILTNDLKPLQIPVESRPLIHPNKKVAQGMVEMFVEVLTSAEAKMKKVEKIEPPPPEEYELRLIIWETRDIPAMDPKKPKTIYIRVSFDPEGWLSQPTEKETDTHMGVDDGKAIYNWRMKFPIKIPCTFPRLYFTCNSFNIAGSDDTLGECYISLKRVFKKLLQEGKLEIKNKWIPFTHPKDPGEPKGELLISIYMVQQTEADQDPVGESWNEPNKNPKLEKPKVGRGVLDFLKGSIFDITKWDFNWDFFGAFRTMLIIAAVVVLFVVLFIAPGILVK